MMAMTERDHSPAWQCGQIIQPDETQFFPMMPGDTFNFVLRCDADYQNSFRSARRERSLLVAYSIAFVRADDYLKIHP